MLRCSPLFCVRRDEWFQGLQHGFIIGILEHQTGQAIAAKTTTQKQLVTAWRLADQTDFRKIRTGAAVRAAGHAHADWRIRESVRRQHGIQAIYQCRQMALAFRHGQATGGQAHARHTVLA